jgi:hypothetical protein
MLNHNYELRNFEVVRSLRTLSETLPLQAMMNNLWPLCFFLFSYFLFLVLHSLFFFERSKHAILTWRFFIFAFFVLFWSQRAYYMYSNLAIKLYTIGTSSSFMAQFYMILKAASLIVSQDTLALVCDHYLSFVFCSGRILDFVSRQSCNHCDH